MTFFLGHLFLYLLLKWFCSCSGAGMAHPNWEAKDEEGRRFAEARVGFRSGCGGVITASSEHAWTSPNIHTSTVPNRFSYMARGEIIKCDFWATHQRHEEWGKEVMNAGIKKCKRPKQRNLQPKRKWISLNHHASHKPSLSLVHYTWKVFKDNFTYGINK